MQDVTRLLDAFLHLDRVLGQVIQTFGAGSYGILFVIIFCETGLVFTPFLPGDSLLFAAGAFAALGALNVFWLFLLLSVAAILGDTVNYWVGRHVGLSFFEKNGRHFGLKPKHLEKTRHFYERYGGKTIVLARFVPIVRTLAPFVAGVGQMSYPRFFAYNVVGGVVWVGCFLLLGYFFGMIPIIKENFTVATLLIVFLSIVPGIVHAIQEKRNAAVSARENV